MLKEKSVFFSEVTPTSIKTTENIEVLSDFFPGTMPMCTG